MASSCLPITNLEFVEKVQMNNQNQLQTQEQKKWWRMNQIYPIPKQLRWAIPETRKIIDLSIEIFFFYYFISQVN